MWSEITLYYIQVIIVSISSYKPAEVSDLDKKIKIDVPPHNPLFTSFLTIYGASCKNIKTINRFSLEKKKALKYYPVVLGE